MKKIFLLIIVLITLNSCIFFDNGSRTIVGDYNLTWIDTPENQFISLPNKTIVDGYVFAVGHNDNFIIAKQHPNAGFDGNYEINTLVTNYFIIKIVSTEPEVLGPLNQSEFKSLVKRLKISHIEFDINDVEKP